MKKIYFKFLLIVVVTTSFIPMLEAQEIASRVVEDGGTGPYSAIMISDESLPTHTIFRPKDLSVFGKKNQLPIIAWGNGACANSPWEHVNFLSEVASHGFLVIAIGPMPKEGEQTRDRSTSSQLTDAIDWAVAQNSDKKSPYYMKIDVKNIAVSGMSCGGLQTLEIAPDPRVTTAVVCNHPSRCYRRCRIHRREYRVSACEAFLIDLLRDWACLAFPSLDWAKCHYYKPRR